MSHRKSGDVVRLLHHAWQIACFPVAFLFVTGIVSPTLSAQSSDTLGTKLTYSGRFINFTWDPKHPWNVQMLSAGVELFAEYRTERQGRVAQKLDSGKPSAINLSSITLRLPDVLTAVPASNVCLYLQLSGGRRIPIRKSRAGAADTEHFAVPAWAAAVSSNSTSQLNHARLQALELGISTAQASVAAQDGAIRLKGWVDADSCDAIKPPPFVAAERPVDVLPANEHESMARRVCIRRVVERRLLLEQGLPDVEQKLRYAAMSLPDPMTAAALLRYAESQKDADRDDLRIREAEFVRYKADWEGWEQVAERDIRLQNMPAFGSLEEDLYVQDITAAVGLEILDFSKLASPVLHTFPKPPVQDVLGYVGGGMETYTRCVHDGKDELAAKLRAWTEQVERAPKLEQMAKEQLRTQCLNAFADLSKQKQQLATLQQQLSAERQKQASPAQAVAAVSTQTAVLNYASCSVQ